MDKEYLKKINKKNAGFSLTEMLVAMFVFSLVITIVFTAFSGLAGNKKQATATQKNMEDAKAAFEYMAKTIRMSSYFTQQNGGCASVDNDGNGDKNCTTIQMYNNSTGKCVAFLFETKTANTHKLKIFEADPKGEDGYKECYKNDDLTNGYVGEMQTGFSNGHFWIQGYKNELNNSNGTVGGDIIGVGKVTISGELMQQRGTQDEYDEDNRNLEAIYLETTVSMRNYDEIGKINMY